MRSTTFGGVPGKKTGIGSNAFRAPFTVPMPTDASPPMLP
jgi:hypothetical protein